jgi:hypothetical protein
MSMRLATAVLFALLASARPAIAASPWEPLPPLPVGVAGGAVFARDGVLDVAGGTAWETDRKLTLADRWRWRDGENGWTSRAALPHPFAHGLYGIFGDRLLIAGGSDGERTRREVYMIDADGDAKVVGTLPEPNAYGGAAVMETTLFVLGGTSDIDDLGRLGASFRAFDLQTGRTASLPDYPGGAVMHARLAVVGDRVLVYPGGTYDSTERRASNLSAVWSYHVPTRRWSRRADYPFSVRGLGVGALDADRFVLTAGGYRSAGGGEMRMTAECFIHDTRIDRYRALPPLPHAAMLMEVVRDGGWVYVIGGEDRARHRVPSVYRARIADLIAAPRR